MKSPSQRLRGRGKGNLLNSAALMWCSGHGIPFRGMCVAAGPARPPANPGPCLAAPVLPACCEALGAAAPFNQCSVLGVQLLGWGVKIPKNKGNS